MAIATTVQGRTKGAGRLRRRVGVAAAALLTTAPFAAVLPAGASTAAAASVAPGARPASVAIAAAPRIPRADVALGPVAATTVEHAELMLKPRDQRALDTFVANVTNKNSPQYHHYLSRGAYRAAFGPTAATVAAATAQLRAEGLQVSGVSSNGEVVSFSGTAATVERAFGTGLERYRLPDGSAGLATTGPVHVPSTIAASVAGVVGLDNLVQDQTNLERPGTPPPGTPKAVSPKFPHPGGSPTACAAASTTATVFGGLTDDAILHAYGAFGLYGVGDFGAGQHIAVFEQQPFLPQDIETFDQCYFGDTVAAQMAGTNGDLSGSRLSIVPVDGGLLQPTEFTQDIEPNLDIDDVSAAAPGANIDVYETPNETYGSIDAYTQIVESDIDQVVTSSWFIGCEQTAQLAAPGLQEEENIVFEQAAAQGQTIFEAAGDTGDDTCNVFRSVPQPSQQNLLSVGDPQAQPYVVSVGGTTIDDATQPPAEHVWNDGAAWGAGGGGISETWLMPSWQRQVALTQSNADDVTNAQNLETSTASESAPYTTPTFCQGTLGISGANCREVPDVSAQADEFTGAVTMYAVAIGPGAEGWLTIGGTSSSAPLWAGMLALVNASSYCIADTVNDVPDVGFASPILYGIAGNPIAYAASFNDVTAGNNDEYGLDNGLSFPARAGYDMASGLGSPQLTTPTNGNGLAYYMCQYGPTLAPPVVTGISPASGPAAGSETITVTGSGFGTQSLPLVKSVQVGAGQATSFTVNSDGSLSVVLPAALTTVPPGSPDPTQDGAGPADIVVSAVDGESSTPSAAAVFDYVDTTAGPTDVPSVTGLSPYGGLDTDPAGAAGAVTVFGAGFVPGETTVDFGGVPGTDVTVSQPYELTVVPPAFSDLSTSPGANTSCPVDDGAAGQPLSPTDDICQVDVTVTVNDQTSQTSNILPPYTGPIELNAFFAPIVPADCNCEVYPQPSEFDYVPTPTITSVSTQTADPASLASEFGGSPANTVTVTGTGMDFLTFNYLTVGAGEEGPTADDELVPVQATGTSFTFLAPPTVGPFEPPSLDPESLPLGFANIGGSSAESAVTYAGVPVVTSVVDPATGLSYVPDVPTCANPPPAAGCGPPLDISGGGFGDATGPIVFDDLLTGFDVSTQFTYDVVSDNSITTTSLQQNPDLVDVLVCSNSGCAPNPPADQLVVYPPGDPSLTGATPSSGPAHGGNTVTIDGSNLGCVVKVLFGSVPAVQFSNAQAILHCGQTGQVLAEAPPGAAGKTIQVSVVTIESEATGSRSNTVSYTYKPSGPSAPQQLAVHPGAGTATVTWKAPASDGGAPIDHYYVAATSPGRPTVAARVPAGATSYDFRYLQPGVPWVFAVQAVSAIAPGVFASTFPVVLPLGDNGYLVATANGAVFGFGSLASSGGTGGGRIAGTVVGIATTQNALGYWLATSTGAVYRFGDAGFLGSASPPRGTRIVGIASTLTGQGYWLVSNTGTVYPFGDAVGHGDANGVTDVVGIARTPDNAGGYYLAEANGAVKAFGDAVLRGDMKGKPLNKPIVGIAVNPVTGGYWEVGGDGGVFSFGAGFYGSMIGRHLNGAGVGMAATPDGHGYWIEAADNGLFTFGDAHYAGNAQHEAESAGVGVAI